MQFKRVLITLKNKLRNALVGGPAPAQVLVQRTVCFTVHMKTVESKDMYITTLKSYEVQDNGCQ